MALLREKRENLVFLSANRFVVINNGSGQDFQIPSAPIQKKDEEETKSNTDDDKESKNCILASAFSSSGKYFAIGDDQKQLHVYKVSPNWELVSTRCMSRRSTALTFPHSEKEVVVADRTGDVYRYSLIDSDSEGELLLGHLSMVLDVIITSKDQYIVTCDRDEKIRISHYPNAYNIHAYCLLHTEYVSQVLYLDQFGCLVSGSGDGRLACWSLDGVNLSCSNKVTQHGEGHTATHNEDDKVKGEGHMEVEGQTGESAEPPGVKKMVFSDHLNVIAVIYYSSKQLSIFSVMKAENGCHLTDTTHHALGKEPWDICFDGQDRLWVLHPCEENPVIVLDCKQDDTGQIQLCDRVSDGTVQKTKTMMCARWQFFQASLECQKQFISLQKIRTHENIQRYLEKKEERINAQKNKPPPPPPPQKKLKTS